MADIRTSTLCWLQIPANSPKRAVEFYKTALDVHIGDYVPTSDMYFFTLKSGGTNKVDLNGGIIKIRDSSEKETLQGGRKYGYASWYFYSDDLEATLQKIEKAGGEALMERTPISAGPGHFADFRDTEGNFFGVFTTAPKK